jgi:hypothetical protein
MKVSWSVGYPSPMALKPLADEDGSIPLNTDGEWDPEGALCIESTGDPALDHILLRCHATEREVRRVASDVRRIKKTTDTLRYVMYALGGHPKQLPSVRRPPIWWLR